MLLTTIEEIVAHLPTSMMNDPSALLTLTEAAEQDYLVPVLGDKLYEKLQNEYENHLADSGPIVAGVLPRNSVSPSIELIRLCQKPIIYFALANNVGVLSVSLNEGGGLNVMETDGYEAADEKRLERFSKDCYKNAYRSLDRVLLYLEKDARKGEPSFLNEWKESEYFYLHKNLLFSTAECLNRYLNIAGSRKDYIEMLPDIRYCQAAYIASAIGDKLLSALIDSDTSSMGRTGEQESPVDLSVWETAKDKIRMALAIYVANRRSDKRFTYTEGEAVLALNQAISYLKDHAEEFGEAYKSSPLYEVPREENKNDTDESVRTIFNPDNASNAIFSPFGIGLKRH